MANKNISLFLFVAGFAILIASYNVRPIGLPIELETKIAWALFNTSMIPIPLSFYFIGVILKNRLFKSVGLGVTAFAIGNMFDFLTGGQYVLGASEYVFAAIVLAYCYYDYKRHS